MILFKYGNILIVSDISRHSLIFTVMLTVSYTWFMNMSVTKGEFLSLFHVLEKKKYKEILEE